MLERISSFIAKSLAKDVAAVMVYMPAPYDGPSSPEPIVNSDPIKDLSFWQKALDFFRDNRYLLSVIIIILAIALFYILKQKSSKKNK